MGYLVKPRWCQCLRLLLLIFGDISGGFLVVERLLGFLALVGALGVGVIMSDVGAERALFPLLHLFLLPSTLDILLPTVLV